jgi:hypothetical protein
MGAYFSVSDGTRNYRLRFKHIKDIYPTPPSVISVNAEPVGSTIVMKDGTAIELDMSIDELKKHIKGWK